MFLRRHHKSLARPWPAPETYVEIQVLEYDSTQDKLTIRMKQWRINRGTINSYHHETTKIISMRIMNDWWYCMNKIEHSRFLKLKFLSRKIKWPTNSNKLYFRSNQVNYSNSIRKIEGNKTVAKIKRAQSTETLYLIIKTVFKANSCVQNHCLAKITGKRELAKKKIVRNIFSNVLYSMTNSSFVINTRRVRIGSLVFAHLDRRFSTSRFYRIH